MICSIVYFVLRFGLHIPCFVLWTVAEFGHLNVSITEDASGSRYFAGRLIVQLRNKLFLNSK